jgi:diguanylate cyclase (GGDEF)-like protein
MCDIDGFKRYNDHYGHPGGDEALRRIARTIAGGLRRADRVYRYGGEEFLVVLEEQSTEAVRAAMDRVRASVEGLEIKHAPTAQRPFLTVSIGIASIDPTGRLSVEHAVEAADKALYRVKAQGGNGAFAAP